LAAVVIVLPLDRSARARPPARAFCARAGASPSRWCRPGPV